MKQKIKRIFLLLLTVVLTAGAGYQGTLPDLESEMGYKIQSQKVKHQPVQTGDKEPAKLQEVPRTNKEYVDIIIKKSRTSEYVKDIQQVITILDKFKNYIEDDRNIQMFNAVASNYIDHAYAIQKKYANRPERHYASYRAMMSLAETARESAMLKSEGVVYTKYLPYSEEGEKYSKANIRANNEALLKQIYDTLYVLKNLD
ncbi:MAG: hypothetical protein K6C94_05265 [Candidatus Gastranaerophilales bacterium]|nr:hypothetical protein [Candidatus Gastranaerophilales bacterium]